jgi:23S rRNA (cytosine1962-C5)-methyltransferase
MSASSVVRVELRRDAGRIGPESGPWLRRNQIARFLGSPDPHGLAQIVDRRGEPIAWGLVSAVSSITVRMLGFGAEPPPSDWLQQRLAVAFAARERYGFAAQRTSGYRVVNSEGDGLPGLVIDRYGEALVVQLGTAPMAAREPELIEWLRVRWSGALHVVVPESAAKQEGLTSSVRDEQGSATLAFAEHGLELEVAAPPSQKTGAYLDQRANRRIIAKLARAHGGALLEVGCHAGGFALHARREGIPVVALDRSQAALALARANAARNRLDGIDWVEADMFEPLRDPALRGPFGTIVLDPPKVALRRGDIERAQQAMSRVATELAGRLADGGHLVLCSCSHHLGRDQLDRIALATGVGLARVQSLGAGVDHPIALAHREGEYLRVNVYQRR